MSGQKAATSTRSVRAPENDVAYYTAANASYFLGTVALLNSLRRAGDEAPLFVVDCGLTAAQRERLSTRATLVPTQEGLHPILQKATGPLAHPAEVMVFVDSDILVSCPLSPLLAQARAGRIVAFEDFGHPSRFFSEWSSLELGEVQPRPYVNSGFFAFSWDTAQTFLPLFSELQRTVDLGNSLVGDGSPDHPFYFPDQDLLNALLCARFDGQVTRLDRRLAPFPPFDGLELTLGDRTPCAYPDGVTPFVLHHTHRKPWLAPLKPNIYSRLFAIVVTDPRACLPIDPRELPLRLTDRPLARVAAWRASKQEAAHRRIRGKLKIRPRIARFLAHFA